MTIPDNMDNFDSYYFNDCISDSDSESSRALDNSAHTNSSLFVSNISTSTTEDQLLRVFKTVGPVKSIRIILDFKTGIPLGRAYVNYYTKEDALRAIELFDLSEIQGKICRVKLSQFNPQKSPKTRLFVKNFFLGADDLFKVFSIFGQISFHRILNNKDPDGCYSVVQYFKEEDAERALNTIDGKIIGGNKVSVEFYEFEKQLPLKPNYEKTFTNLYVKGFPLSFTKQDLLSVFSKFGRVKSCIIGFNEKVSKAFGFVDFLEYEQALAAINSLNGKDFSFGKLYVSRAQDKSERTQELNKIFNNNHEAGSTEKNENLFIKNIDKSISAAQLRKIFEPYGQIVSLRVLLDNYSLPRGFAYITYSTPDEAKAALLDLNNKIIGSQAIFVEYASDKVEEIYPKQSIYSAGSSSNFCENNTTIKDYNIDSSYKASKKSLEQCLNNLNLEHSHPSGYKNTIHSDLSNHLNHKSESSKIPIENSSELARSESSSEKDFSSRNTLNKTPHRNANFPDASIENSRRCDSSLSLSSNQSAVQSNLDETVSYQFSPKRDERSQSGYDFQEENLANHTLKNTNFFGTNPTKNSNLEPSTKLSNAKQSLQNILINELYPLILCRCEHDTKQVANMLKLLSNAQLVLLIEDENAREEKVLQALDIIACNRALG